MKERILKLAILAGAVTAPAIGWAVGWRPSLPAATSPWLVLAAAAAAVAGMVSLAAALRLPDLARTLVSGGRSMDAEFDELAEVAERARREGALVAAADPRARRSPVLVAGFLLLMRDPDEGLMRSSLEIEGEVVERDGSASRALAARLCRGAWMVLMLGAMATSGVLAGYASGPLAISVNAAGAAFAAVMGFFCWHAVGARLAGALEQENARHALRTEAMIQTMLGIRAGEDYRTVRDRLARLTPEGSAAAGAEAGLMAA